MGVEKHPAKNSETSVRMTMKCLPNVKPNGGWARNEIFNLFYVFGLVCKLSVNKVSKRINSLFSGNATSGHGNFTKFCRIIDINVRC